MRKRARQIEVEGRGGRCKVTSRSECVFQAVRQAVSVWRRQTVIERKKRGEEMCFEGKGRKRISVLFRRSKN